MTNGLSLEVLGLTKEEAAERVIAQIAKDLCFEPGEDEDGYVSSYETQFAKGIEKIIRQRIDAEVVRIADEVFAPRVTEMIEECTLQKTNQWGEATGKKVTFREYLVERAEAYMTEQVNYEGKPKGTDGYSWSAKGTRVAYMIDKHLHYSIQSAMQAALQNANTTICKGLNEAVRIAIAGLTVNVKTEVKS